MHVTYRHSHTGYATGCPQDLFLRETCYSVLPTRWKPAPRHKDRIISRHLGFFYFLDLPQLRTTCGESTVTAKRTSLGSLGSPYVGTEHAWCAPQWDGNRGGGRAQGWPFNLPSHHMDCDLLLKSPGVILSGDKKQAAQEQQPRY